MRIRSASGRSGGQGVAGQPVARLELDDRVAGLRQLPVVQVNEVMERLVARELSEAGDPVIELDPRGGLTRDARAS